VTRERPEASRPLPGLYSILNQSIAIMIQEIVKQKLASSPPDLLIRPDVSLSFLGYLRRPSPSSAVCWAVLGKGEPWSCLLDGAASVIIPSG